MSAQPTIDELLDQAVRALNRGDRPTADALAGQVLQVDRGNADAEELLAALTDSGEIRRMTIIFADLVDSTALSTRLEPEVYRTVVGRYRDEVLRIVDRYEGHVGSTKGDGLLAVFGHPKAHENDVRRAVLAGLDITREVSTLSERVRTRYDGALVRVLTAAGMNDAALERVELARQMADETGWRIYDAELLRLRAHTSDDPDARHADLRAAIELAQTQGALIYELRAAADDFELIGEPARAALMDALSRFPSAQTWPELARVRALLG